MHYNLIKDGEIVNTIILGEDTVIGSPEELPDRPEMPKKPGFKNPKKPTTKEIKALEVWRIEVQEWRQTVLKDWELKCKQVRESNKNIYQPPEGMEIEPA